MTDMIKRVADTAKLTKGKRGSWKLKLAIYFYPHNKGGWINAPESQSIGVANDEELLEKLEAICKEIRKNLEASVSA
jgi:hypothetical protein